MNIPLTLEAVQSDFHQWRQQKPNARTPIPLHLREKAIALRADFSSNQITKALGINHSMLKSWSGERERKPSKQNRQPSESIEFTTIPATTDSNPFPGQTAQLSCDLSNGQRWCLQGGFTSEQLTAFIQSLHQVTGGRA